MTDFAAMKRAAEALNRFPVPKRTKEQEAAIIRLNDELDPNWRDKVLSEQRRRP